MPGKSANVKNEEQYKALQVEGTLKERAAKIANSPDASSSGKKSGSGADSSRGGITAQNKKAWREGGKAAHR